MLPMEWSFALAWAFVPMVFWFKFSLAEHFVDFTVSRWAPCLEQRKESLIVSDISVKQCVFECAVRSECIFLGYKSVLNVCELHIKNISEFNEIDGSNQCIFILREDIITTEVEKVCTCDDGQLCDVHTGQCNFKECKVMTLSNGKVYGNVRHVNAKVRVRCNSGYVESNGMVEATCNPDGSWSYTPSCVIQSSITTTTTTTETTAAPNSGTVCGNSLDIWIHHNTDPTFQVTLSQLSQNQDDASLACGALNAKLVKIDEEWKQTFLADSLANCAEYSATCYWIDGSNIGTTWQFTDSSAMPTDDTVFWDAEQPDSAGGKTCVAMNSNQRWFNKNCNNVCGYICERLTSIFLK
ncbi:uncharacterized protein LOC123533016 [Mercenaria mercenaria]|uniref:uncharacterized protein LOC123533016 n=1 Tax=Mercenaria mercenaria TaxID=6596 RepID=UPI00234F5F81|nr:uncharacterized protein LOC123533016 [Mercenaria mercenaria]